MAEELQEDLRYLESEEQLRQFLPSEDISMLRANLLLNFCCFHKISKWKSILPLAEEALEISTKTNYSEGRGLSLLEMGYQNWFSDQFNLAFRQLADSATILKETPNYFKYSRAVAVKSSILWGHGKRNEAIIDMFNALRHVRKSTNENDSLWLQWFLGIFYFDLKDYQIAEEQYLLSLKIIKKSTRNTRDAYAYCMIGYGGVLMQTNRQKEALDYFNNAKSFCEKNGLWMQEARVLFELGNHYSSIGDTENARIHLQKSYDIRKKQNTKPALVSSLLSLAKLEKDYLLETAFKFAFKALQLSDIIDSKSKIQASHQLLAKLFEQKGDFKNSHYHLNHANEVTAELNKGGKINSELKNLEKKFTGELMKREAELLLHQNQELKEAYNTINIQYQEISDSISYAKRIQTAILPPLDLFDEYLKETFLIYQPKQVVAGDFY
ncbi:MAG: tetratricopeptide repeat protein, partial [Flavobacteriales bacterium]|nr:tetratricopeptide repeat protein [Flavobacteriales bacterium]